jgi:acyl carrier protein
MSVLEKIKNIVAEQLDVAENEVIPEANFVNDLGADSLDLTELIMAMEDEFGLEIDDEEAQNLRTVNDAIKYIESRQTA